MSACHLVVQFWQANILCTIRLESPKEEVRVGVLVLSVLSKIN